MSSLPHDTKKREPRDAWRCTSEGLRPEAPCSDQLRGMCLDTSGARLDTAIELKKDCHRHVCATSRRVFAGESRAPRRGVRDYPAYLSVRCNQVICVRGASPCKDVDSILPARGRHEAADATPGTERPSVEMMVG